jgi:hypothetical protein
MSVRGACRPQLWLRGGALLVAAVLTLPIAAATAKTPSGRDVTSARKLMGDLARFYQAGLDTRRQAHAAVNASVQMIKATCPNALPATLSDGPKREQAVSMQMLTEAAYDLALVASQPTDHAALVEAAALDRLHFSRRAATRDAREIARGQRLTAALKTSDLCADLQAAAANGFTSVPPATRHFVAMVNRVFSVPAPSFDDLDKHLGPYLTTRRDKAAVKRVRDLGMRYTEFAFTLGLNAGGKLVSVLTGMPDPLDGQAGTTAAANTRSTSASNEIPAASAASGSRLVSVSPGMGLASST